MKRSLLCSLMLVLLVGVVSADTAIFFTTNATDGMIYTNTDAVWDTHHHATSGTSSLTSGYDYVYISASTTSGQIQRLYRGVQIYDTSSLPDTAVISAASIGLYQQARHYGLGCTSVNIVKFNIDGTIDGADFDRFDYTRFATDINISALGATRYYNWSFNSLGISNISTTGNSGFGALLTWDIEDNPGFTWVSSGVTDYWYRSADKVVNPSFLEITYTTPDTTPPDSITDLASITTCSSSNWTWTNPADEDFNHTYAMINNAWIGNFTNTTTFLYVTGLAESTAYELATKTVDTTGNINATWVNQTAETGACGTAPVAAFSANNLTVCQGTDTQFTDESSNTPTSWSWDFGDGNTSIEQSPLKIYDVIGLKTVVLTAGNLYGSDLESKIDYIDVTDCTLPTPTPTIPSEPLGLIESHGPTWIKWVWVVDPSYSGSSASLIIQVDGSGVYNLPLSNKSIGDIPTEYLLSDLKPNENHELTMIIYDTGNSTVLLMSSISAITGQDYNYYYLVFVLAIALFLVMLFSRAIISCFISGVISIILCAYLIVVGQNLSSEFSTVILLFVMLPVGLLLFALYTWWWGRNNWRE